MRKLKIISTFLFFIATTFFIHAQEWKTYPYAPQGSIIQFPQDEGRHPDEGIEWWYTTGHFIGAETGNEYTFMLTYFYYSTFLSEGFRVFNIANETTGEFYSDMQFCSYPGLGEDRLDITAVLLTHQEKWHNKTDDSGALLPFEYELQAQSLYGSVDFSYNTVKRPLILDGDGYFPQGATNYTYYYSQTGVELSGIFSIGGITEEVTGVAWIDRQYGSFNPATGEKYEWFSMQLSNGMDVNFWNIFDDQGNTPTTPEYRILSAYVNEDQSFTTSDFSLERLKYDFVPGTDRVYAQQWRLQSDSMDIDVIITSRNNDNEVLLPFKFFEGSTIVEGTVGGVPVTGRGFTELLHRYNHPQVVFTAPFPGELWTYQQPIEWDLQDPDEGRPIYYDLSVKNVNSDEYVSIAQGLQDTFYLWDADGFALDEEYTFHLFAYSIDTTLHNETITIDPVALPAKDEHFMPNIIISPNPASSQVRVSWEREARFIPGMWQLLNAQGKVVLSQKVPNQSNDFDFDISDLPSGMYELFILPKDGLPVVKMVVVN